MTAMFMQISKHMEKIPEWMCKIFFAKLMVNFCTNKNMNKAAVIYSEADANKEPTFKLLNSKQMLRSMVLKS